MGLWNYLPFSQLIPENPEEQLQLSPSLRLRQAPLFWQGLSEQGSRANKKEKLFTICIQMVRTFVSVDKTMDASLDEIPKSCITFIQHLEKPFLHLRD